MFARPELKLEVEVKGDANLTTIHNTSGMRAVGLLMLFDQDQRTSLKKHHDRVVRSLSAGYALLAGICSGN